MSNRIAIIACVSAIIATGCSKKADNISASYISPVTYQNFTCPQIAEEMQRVSARAAEAAGIQNKAATKDTVAMTVGLVVFWPSLFFLSGGDGANAVELARLKGSLDTMEQVGIRKNCGIQIQRPEPPKQQRAEAESFGANGLR